VKILEKSKKHYTVKITQQEWASVIVAARYFLKGHDKTNENNAEISRLLRSMYNADMNYETCGPGPESIDRR